MIFSLTKHELVKYVSTQINMFMPDNNPIDSCIEKCMDTTLERVEHCFKRIIIPYYRININDQKKPDTIFNHLNTDQYAMFLYILSNELWNWYQDFNIASKVMYLNKILHSINCMYEVKLPDIFCFYHTIGTVIGKSATFSNYIVIFNGVTIGAQSGKGSVFEEGVSLLPQSSVVGNSHIGKNSSIGIGSTIYNMEVPENAIAITDSKGNLIIKKTNKFYNDSVFEKF